MAFCLGPDFTLLGIRVGFNLTKTCRGAWPLSFLWPHCLFSLSHLPLYGADYGAGSLRSGGELSTVFLSTSTTYRVTVERERDWLDWPLERLSFNENKMMLSYGTSKIRQDAAQNKLRSLMQRNVLSLLWILSLYGLHVYGTHLSSIYFRAMFSKPIQSSQSLSLSLPYKSYWIWSTKTPSTVPLQVPG